MKKILKVLVSLALAVVLLNAGLVKGNAAVYELTYSEKESNSTMHKANNITKYFPKNEDTKLVIKGKINGKSDVDYYKFTTTYEYTNVKLKFSKENIPVGNIKILDSKGNRIYNGDEDYEIIYTTLPKGTYYIKVTSTKKSSGKKYQIALTAKEFKTNIKATVQNNLGKNDTITIENLTPGKMYLVYWDYWKMKYKKLTPTESKVTLSIGPLNYNGGIVFISIPDTMNPEEQMIPVKYSAEKLNPIDAKNVKIKNKIGGKDTITLKGLKKGYTYTIYKDEKLKKKLVSYTAKKKTSVTLKVKQLGKKAGSVYVVVKKSGYKSSDPTKVSYKAEPTKALSSKSVKVINGKDQDIIKFKNLKKGATYVIYKDKKKQTVIASFTATKSKKTITVPQLGANGGKIYITAQLPGYGVSAVTVVKFPKEK